MVRNMKHIKLFENWAEEVSLPWYLDEKQKSYSYHKPGNASSSYSIWNYNIQKNIKDPKCILGINMRSQQANFKSFSDYDFWLPQYDEIYVNQSFCEYMLEDCFGIPRTIDLKLRHNKIRSLKSLDNCDGEDRSLSNLSITVSNIENLKYCPLIHGIAAFNNNPLLSYYGITTDNINGFDEYFCGALTYAKAGFHDKIPSLDQLNDKDFSANIFCNFKNIEEKTLGFDDIKHNPWKQIYHDPNGVDNFEFLFIPFYENSEKFRDHTREYLGDIDLSGVSRNKEKIW
jgi:hypothetical protein